MDIEKPSRRQIESTSYTQLSAEGENNHEKWLL